MRPNLKLKVCLNYKTVIWHSSSNKVFKCFSWSVWLFYFLNIFKMGWKIMIDSWGMIDVGQVCIFLLYLAKPSMFNLPRLVVDPPPHTHPLFPSNPALHHPFSELSPFPCCLQCTLLLWLHRIRHLFLMKATYTFVFTLMAAQLRRCISLYACVSLKIQLKLFCMIYIFWIRPAQSHIKKQISSAYTNPLTSLQHLDN